jgi:hypothetical protein
METNLKLVYFMHTGKNNKIHTMEFEITSLKSIVFPHYFHTISIMWKFGIKIRFPYQGIYSYIRVLPDGFLLKSTVFTVCKHEYMNIHPPPQLSCLATALFPTISRNDPKNSFWEKIPVSTAHTLYTSFHLVKCVVFYKMKKMQSNCCGHCLLRPQFD